MVGGWNMPCHSWIPEELAYKGRRGPQVVGATAITSGTEQVIQRQAGTHEGTVDQRPPIHRKEEALESNQVRCQADQSRSLDQSFAHQVDTQILEVAQATVHHF